MNAFENFIISPLNVNTRTTDKLGKVLQIAPQAFQQMLTQNGHDRRIANHWLIEACADKLQKVRV